MRAQSGRSLYGRYDYLKPCWETSGGKVRKEGEEGWSLVESNSTPLPPRAIQATLLGFAAPRPSMITPVLIVGSLVEVNLRRHESNLSSPSSISPLSGRHQVHHLWRIWKVHLLSIDRKVQEVDWIMHFQKKTAPNCRGNYLLWTFPLLWYLLSDLIPF